jgi:GTPase-associated protein 1, N-terminal domain type 1
MVDLLMEPIIVHQALHGYSDGHRLISSSLPLDSSAARIMLVMSDLSGPGVKPEQSGYLTGYALDMIGKYVLARTWAAPEMPRPGCVWTHSLIIDYADLATMSSAEPLLSLFKRPGDDGVASNYAAPIKVLQSAAHQKLSRHSRGAQIVNALYSCTDAAIVAECMEPSEDEQFVTAIWMQQWPRLRRAFGFCTCSGMDRASKGVALDLQLAPVSDRQLASKFPNAMLAHDVPHDDALGPLLRDLAEPGESTFREFLRRAGGDVDGGRRAMLPLCHLYSSLFAQRTPDLVGAVTALANLDGNGRPQARSVRSLLFRQALRSFDGLDDTVFEFLLSTLESSSALGDEIGAADQFGIALWRRSPDRFYHALVEGGPLGELASYAVKEMPQQEIIDGLRTHASLIPPIIEQRPDILLESEFWRMSEADDELASNILAKDAGQAAFALLAAGRTGPASMIVQHAEAGALVRALESPEADHQAAQYWLRALASDPDKLGAGLGSGKIGKLSTVADLARYSSPDSVSSDLAEDPWLTALKHGRGQLSQSDEEFLAAFLCTRALGSRSRSPAELLRFSYARVYRALRANRYGYDVESMVTRRLEWGSWLVWDNSSRLRETVVRKFVEDRLDPDVFGRLADDGNMALALIDEAAQTSRGRRYLEDVHKRLKNSNEKGMKARADYIAKKID